MYSIIQLQESWIIELNNEKLRAGSFYNRFSRSNTFIINTIFVIFYNFVEALHNMIRLFLSYNQ